jgi:hypothetical protein
LDAAQDRSLDDRQRFYAGFARRPEITHDAHFHRAYERAAEEIRQRGGHVRRVVLDFELKREYQRFLQERNRQKRDGGGRPDRTGDEIREWALAHRLPYEDEHVQFPDVRIEYEDRDGRRDTEDLEIVTPQLPKDVQASDSTARAVLGSAVAVGADAAGRSIPAWRRTSYRD